ncbi:MAG: V-type ATPase subunit [Oscillospiraceae bacterium]|nr:V-type ATPase subunit [Oscillospiraceae bacterium]
MSKLKDTDFLYISTNLRARENRMLTRERMERMLEARTDEDAAKVLSECGYTGLEHLTVDTLNDSLARSRAELFQELASFTPNSDMVDVFRIKYDYHNAKALVKCASTGREAEPMLIDSGRYSLTVLTAAVVQENYSLLTDAMRSAITEASEVLASTGDPQLSDLILDKACYAEMLSIAKRSGSDFLTGYVQLQIDSANLKTAVRCLRMKKGSDMLTKALLPGGNASLSAITGAVLSGGNLESVFTGYLQEAAVLGTAAAKGGRQTAFEAAVDNGLCDYLKSSRLTSFGDSVLVAFAAAKENEITAARIIMSGRLSGIPADAIRERLREAYV